MQYKFCDAHEINKVKNYVSWDIKGTSKLKTFLTAKIIFSLNINKKAPENERVKEWRR